MYLKDIIKEVATRTDTTQTLAREMYDALADILHEELLKKETESFTLPKIAVFSKTLQPAKTGKNPATGEPVEVGERMRLRVSPNDSLKKAVKVAI